MKLSAGRLVLVAIVTALVGVGLYAEALPSAADEDAIVRRHRELEAELVKLRAIGHPANIDKYRRQMDELEAGVAARLGPLAPDVDRVRWLERKTGCEVTEETTEGGTLAIVLQGRDGRDGARRVLRVLRDEARMLRIIDLQVTAEHYALAFSVDPVAQKLAEPPQAPTPAPLPAPALVEGRTKALRAEIEAFEVEKHELSDRIGPAASFGPLRKRLEEIDAYLDAIQSNTTRQDAAFAFLDGARDGVADLNR
ncbi:MAG: hypothetical protein RIT81_42885 [Deltaproteobacteria bacterium]